MLLVRWHNRRVVKPLLLLVILSLCGCVTPARRAALLSPWDKQEPFVRKHIHHAELHNAFVEAHRLEKMPGPLSDADDRARAEIPFRLHGFLYSAGDKEFAEALEHEGAGVRRVAAASMELRRLEKGFPRTLAVIAGEGGGH